MVGAFGVLSVPVGGGGGISEPSAFPFTTPSWVSSLLTVSCFGFVFSGDNFAWVAVALSSLKSPKHRVQTNWNACLKFSAIPSKTSFICW